MPSDDELRRVLGPHVDADVTQTFQRFQEVTRQEDPAAFVAYLVEQGILAPEAAARVAAELLEGEAAPPRPQTATEPLPAEKDDAPTVVEPREANSASGRSDGSSARWVPLSTPPPPGVEGERLRIGKEIGRGGMGRVFRAEQIELGRPVAFKLLRGGYNDVVKKRFLREARVTAQLEHPGVVPVHGLEISPDGRSVGYAMKLVEGKTLRAYLTECTELYALGKPVDDAHALPRRLEHFLKICDTLAFAHDRGVLHRDLKPSNFMLGSFNEVYVMDWGIARRADASPEEDESQGPRPDRVGTETDLTAVGEVIGSLRYMSPEQAEGHGHLDARSDQYALGLVLFELVSLRPAISSSTNEGALELATSGTKAPLEHVSRRERIPPELRAIVAKATAFAPDDRYPSVAALAEDVRRYLRGEAVAARPDTIPQALARWITRHRTRTLGVLAAVVGLAALALTWTLYAGAAAELAERRRGDARTALFVDVAARGRHIDAQFQRMEEALEGLRTAAEWALEGPEPPEADAPLFFVDDFADPARRPKDFTEDTAYRWPVSVQHPVVALAPALDRAVVLPRLRRLSPLRHHIRAMLVGAALGDHATPPAERVREVLLRREGPIDYAYVDLPEGAHVVYPGIASLPPDYDVRTASFYRMSENRRGKRWGAPYVDSTTDEKGDDLVLPCTQGLWSSAGRFLGVAGVEITVTKLVETGLRLPGRETARTTLVNAEGKKVIDSGDAGKRFVASGKDESVALEEFELPEVVAAVRRGQPGVIDTRRDGRALVAALVRIDSLGWYYVVEVLPESLDLR